MGVVGRASLSYPFPNLRYWYTRSLVRRSQHSYVHKHSALELTEKHKHILQLTANCN